MAGSLVGKGGEGLERYGGEAVGGAARPVERGLAGGGSDRRRATDCLKSNQGRIERLAVSWKTPATIVTCASAYSAQIR